MPHAAIGCESVSAMIIYRWMIPFSLYTVSTVGFSLLPHHRRRPTLCLHSFDDDSWQEDDEEGIEENRDDDIQALGDALSSLDVSSPRELEDALRFVVSDPKVTGAKRVKDLLSKEELAQLQELVRLDEEDRSNPHLPTKSFDALSAALITEDKDDEGGVFLSGEDYLESRDFMNPDGSLTSETTPFGTGKGASLKPEDLFSDDLLEELNAAPPSPPSYSNVNTKNPTIQDLLDAQQRRDERLQSPTDNLNRKIHEEIMKDEQEFIHQSNTLFARGMIDLEAARQAQEERRTKRYQERLDRDVAELEKNLEEWDEVLRQKREEQKKQNSTEGNGVEVEEEEAWERVDDPSTGDHFYWNKVTGEMRYADDSDDDDEEEDADENSE